MVLGVGDPVAEGLARGAQAVHAGLSKWPEKGRIAPSARKRLEVASAVDRLADCDLVIEAAPERSEFKRKLRRVVGDLRPAGGAGHEHLLDSRYLTRRRRAVAREVVGCASSIHRR